ncbi:MAG: Trk family potassium uptake protein [Firmicutes bacterium]|nr:Trk family potassium uptake protein [Bacillota bacterium]
MNRPKPINPARVMVAGFIGVILTGSLLLSLPAARIAGELSYIDALFTATSAVCVTGLVVVDTGTFYSFFGQMVIMILIFIGSLGFMTMTIMIFIFLGRKITLRDRLLTREALNQESLSGMVRLATSVLQIALLFILSGASLMAFRFIPQLGYGRGIFFSLFHAISAFGNAGFDLFGNFDSLTRFPADYLVNGTMMVLFIFGGLGFTVVIDLLRHFRFRSRISLHSRMVLLISGVLLFSGTICIFTFEYSNPETMGSLNLGAKLFTALFTAATPRTAGFNVLDTAALGYPTFLLLLVLMFIGASPASTGGGIKTTTFGVIFLTLMAMIRGRQEPIFMQRRFTLTQIMKAVAIVSAAVALIFTAIFILTLAEDIEFSALLFEVFSAFGTVGLSRGITAELGTVSKLVLIITMLGGRVGPLTLMVALVRKQQKDILHYPEEQLLIG